MWQAAVILATMTVYWGTLIFKSLRLALRTGRSSRPWPKGSLERGLMIVWVSDIALMQIQPVLILAKIREELLVPLITPVWSIPEIEIAGAVVVGIGLWLSFLSWHQMGDSWRLGTTSIAKDPTALVSVGVFGWVRHPIYAAQGVILYGALLLLPTPLTIAITVVHSGWLYAKSVLEERHALDRWGDEYVRYMGRVGRFLPKLFGRSDDTPGTVG